MILELAWKHKIMDFAMPYFIQVTRELSSKVEKLEQNDAKRQSEDAEETHKPMMLAEPQLMLTAGPGMGEFVDSRLLSVITCECEGVIYVCFVYVQP